MFTCGNDTIFNMWDVQKVAFQLYDKEKMPRIIIYDRQNVNHRYIIAFERGSGTDYASVRVTEWNE